MDYKELGKSGVKVPVLGLGTWGIGGFSSKHVGGDDQAVRALRLGLELEMRFIDTAEMYANGHSEEVVAGAVAAERANVFIASKVSGENLSYERRPSFVRVQPKASPGKLHRSVPSALAQP